MPNEADLRKIVASKDAIYKALFEQTKVALDELGVANMNLSAYLAQPRITVAIINEAGIKDSIIEIYARVLQFAVEGLKEKWTELPEITVTTTASPGAWEVTITNDHRRPAADGWHNISPSGLPYAYIAPGTGAYPFGTYRPGLLRRLIGKTWFSAQKEYTRSGCLTVLVHEALEMLVDPAIKTVSKPDSKGRNWLIEVCSSSVFGGYFGYKEPISGQWCVMPNFAFPSAFDLEGVAPFDHMGVLTAPFTWTPKSYPYYVDANGELVKILA